MVEQIYKHFRQFQIFLINFLKYLFLSIIFVLCIKNNHYGYKKKGSTGAKGAARRSEIKAGFCICITQTRCDC